jgi:hypothetical protein
MFGWLEVAGEGWVDGSLCIAGQVTSVSLSKKDCSEKHDGVAAILSLKYYPGYVYVICCNGRSEFFCR